MTSPLLSSLSPSGTKASISLLPRSGLVSALLSFAPFAFLALCVPFVSISTFATPCFCIYLRIISSLCNLYHVFVPFSRCSSHSAFSVGSQLPFVAR